MQNYKKISIFHIGYLYNKFIKLNDIFLVNGVGICSKRDKLVFQDRKEDLLRILKDFKHFEEKKLREKYKIHKDSQGWKLLKAKEIVNEFGASEEYVLPVLYRPFDKKQTFYVDKGGFLARPVYQIFKHVLKNNINLIVSKINRQVSTNYFFVSDIPTDLHILDTARDATYNFPLWLYNDESLFKELENKLINPELKRKLDEYKKGEQEYTKHKEWFLSIDSPDEYQVATHEEHKATYEALKNALRTELANAENDLFSSIDIETATKAPNISPSFIKFINEKYKTEFTPEQIVGYVYAILQSPAYQMKYKEFFRTAFPKIPLCNKTETFAVLSELGTELIEYHILKKIPQGDEYKNVAFYGGNGDNIVVKPEHKTIKTGKTTEERLYFNKNQYFGNVPEKVYNYYIGGYQVLNKYLKDRKGKELNIDAVLNIEKIAKILLFTIKQKALIDKATTDWI